MKKFVVALLIVAFATLPFAANANELLKTEQIELQPVNFATYVRNGIDYVAEILSRLLKTGKPALLFYEPSKIGLEGVFFENFLMEDLDLVGGITLSGETNAEGVPLNWKDKLYGGVEYELPISDTQSIFSRLRIGGYVSKKGVCFGIAFELQPAEAE